MNAMVTRKGLLDMQVCVPRDWTDEQAEEFANQQNPTGIESKWRMKHEDDETLSGCAERVQCAECDSHVHIMLSC